MFWNECSWDEVLKYKTIHFVIFWSLQLVFAKGEKCPVFPPCLCQKVILTGKKKVSKSKTFQRPGSCKLPGNEPTGVIFFFLNLNVNINSIWLRFWTEDDSILKNLFDWFACVTLVEHGYLESQWNAFLHNAKRMLQCDPVAKKSFQQETKR